MPDNITSSFQNRDSLERLSGSIERVTFHSKATGFCVLRVKVKGYRDLVTVVGSAASVTAGEFIDCLGFWANDLQHGLQFKANELKIVPPVAEAAENLVAWQGQEIAHEPSISN